MTETISDTRTAPQTSHGDGDHDRFSHYVSKKALDDYYFGSGNPVTALCGKKWSPNKDTKGLPICPECREKWESFGTDKEGPDGDR